jgi:glycosyltransferase involved in cell wall biosynthesis
MAEQAGADASRSAAWCVFQIGAREHYAVARAINAAGLSTHLFADYWASDAAILPVPAALRQRFHPDLNGANVYGFNLPYLKFEALQRICGRNSWQHIEARNSWFQKLACKALTRYLDTCASPPVVFAYSYAAGDILKLAKSFGCKTLLGQIDPGPAEFRLVEELTKRAGHPAAAKPSPRYWQSWREECETADKIIVNSPWSQTALLEEGVAEDKLEVVPLVYEAETQNRPIAIEPRSCADDKAQPLSVLYLGQVIPRKGILELVDAIRAMQGRPVSWTIVGGGEPELMEILRNLPQTTVVGPVSRTEAANCYQDADVFILPTHSDGYALTQLEAAAHGLPIIASKNCGEVVEQGVTGILLDEVSAYEIERAVMTFVDKPETLNHYCRNIHETKRFTIKNLGEKLLQIANA